MNSQDYASELKRLTEAIWVAAEQRDRQVLEQLLDEDFVMALSDGRRLCREDVVKLWTTPNEELSNPSHLIDEWDVRVFGDAGVVMALVTNRWMKGNESMVRVERIFDVWRRIEGSWRLVSSRPTVVEGMSARPMDLASEVVVVKDGLMLALLRSGNDPCWWLPGGMAEPGEQPIDAAVRETLEETGLVVHPRPLHTWRTRLRSGGDRLHCTFVADHESGDVVLNHEHTDFEWISADEFAERWRQRTQLVANDLLPHVQTMIQMLDDLVAGGAPSRRGPEPAQPQ